MKLIKSLIKIIVVLLFITGCSKQIENNNINDGYKFMYQSKFIQIGDIYDENTIGISNTFFENENCAFSEKDITYIYNDFQIQTYENNKKDQVIIII